MRLLLLGAAVALTGCKEVSEEPWQLSIYMAADNDLGPAASRDLRELLTPGVIPPNVEVLVFVDQVDPAWAAPISVEGVPDTPEAQLLLITDAGVEVLETWGEVDSASVETLSDFLDVGAARPADRRGLVLWDHGSGPGFAYDFDARTGPIPLDTLLEAFVDPSTGEVLHHFDVLGFDACLMANLHALELFEPVADVFIASPEIEPAAGWPYDALMEGLWREDLDARVFGEVAVAAYAERYGPETPSGVPLGLAAFEHDPDILSEYADLAALLRAADGAGALTLHQELASAAAAAHPYGVSQPGLPHPMVDAGPVVAALQSAHWSGPAGRFYDDLLFHRVAWSGGEALPGSLGLSLVLDPGLLDQVVARADAAAVGEALAPGSALRQSVAALDSAPPVVTLAAPVAPADPAAWMELTPTLEDETSLDHSGLFVGELGEDDSLTLSAWVDLDARGAQRLSEPQVAPAFSVALSERGGLDAGTLLIEQGRYSFPVQVETPAGPTEARILLSPELEPLSLALTQAGGGQALHDWSEVVDQDWWITPITYTLEAPGGAALEVLGEAHHASAVALVRAPVDRDALAVELQAVDVAGQLTWERQRVQAP